LVVILSALVARALMLLLVDPLADLHTGDAAYFLAVAHSIASGAGHSLNGVPTAFQAPGYAFFLAFVPAPLVVQSLLTVAVGVLVARRFNLVAALLFVTCPFLIVYEWRLLGEAPAIDLLVAAFVLVAFPKRKWEPIAAGFLLGLAILTRDTLLLLPLFLLIPAYFYRQASRRVLLVAAVAWLTILPWQIHNGGPISEGRIGFNLWVGTWERDPHWVDDGIEQARWPVNAFRNDAEWRRLKLAFEQKQDAVFRNVAIDRIVTEPFSIAASWAIRYHYLWLGTRTEQIQLRAHRDTLLWKAEKAGFYLLNLATLIAGVIGMVIAVRRDRRWCFAATPILYIALLYVPFHNSEPRYSLPAIPFLLAFAAQALTAIRARSDRGSAASPAAHSPS
jgi:4-amino-4-deoxy-L-arabinose transferase-like glycosyltransferase